MKKITVTLTIEVDETKGEEILAEGIRIFLENCPSGSGPESGMEAVDEIIHCAADAALKPFNGLVRRFESSYEETDNFSFLKWSEALRESTPAMRVSR